MTISQWLMLSLGEWRRHWQLYLWLLLGLVLAAALFNGVENLNRAANSSFQTAEQTSKQAPGFRIYSLSPGHQISRDFWLQLRRHGIAAEPVLIGQIQLDDNQWLPLRGQSLPNITGGDHWQTLASQSTINRLAVDERGQVRSRSGQTLPPLTAIDGVGGWLMMDIAPAAALLGSGEMVTLLEIATLSASQQQWLQRNLPADLQLRQQQAEESRPLLAAFSLNLRALGLLSFLVGGLLVLHAVSSLLDHRQPRLAILSELGVTRAQLLCWSFSELVLLSLLCGILGAVLGLHLANWLAPGVELTLTMLYQSDSVLTLNWDWSQAGRSILMIGLTLALLVVLQLTPAKRQRQCGQLLLLPLAMMVLWLTSRAQTQGQSLLLSALTVLLAIIVLPNLLAWLLQLLSRMLPLIGQRERVLSRWTIADLMAHRQGLNTALIAITLALATAVATRILTGSFAVALDGHLQQRLFAVAYIHGSGAQLLNWQRQLANIDSITDIKSLSQRSGQYLGQPLQIKVIESRQQPSDTFHFKAVEPKWWQAAANGQCLINEPMALQQGLSLGQSIRFNSGNSEIGCRIAGIYYDYGNPRWEISLERGFGVAQMGEMPLLGLGIQTTSMQFNPQIEQHLLALGIPHGAINWQQQVLDTARSLFSRTFAITDALAWLTLGVAMLAWIASLMAQWRRWGDSNQLLATLGIEPRTLKLLRLAQLGLLLIITLAFAAALGMLLGWQLLARINPLSFGWSMPIEFSAGQWWLWIVVVLVSTLALAMLPQRQQQLPARGEWQ